MAVKSAEEYIETHPDWKEEISQLRDMLVSTEMEETIKWGVPVYTISDKNVVGIAAFKNHLALWFYNGALLRDNTALLENANEGKTQGLRQIRFRKGDKMEPEILQKYVQEAIENQKAGKVIQRVTNKEFLIPPELQVAFEQDKSLEESFNSLTSGRQREYAEYIAEPKREATKQKRLEKIVPMIREGKALYDKYKNC